MSRLEVKTPGQAQAVVEQARKGDSSIVAVDTSH